MVNIIDRRNQALGGQSYDRSESSITHIAWHYTAVARESGAFITGHENYWKNTLGWRRGGYHYYIAADAKIYQNYNLTTISNGVGGHNSKVVNICVEANSSSNYTKAQEDARRDLTLYLIKRLGIPVDNVGQHKEFSRQSTSCAGYTKTQMRAFRDELRGGNAQAAKPSKPSTPSKKSDNTIAAEVLAGKWGNGNDRVNRLKAAGYNPQVIQSLVNSLASGRPSPKPLKAVQVVAGEVLAGKWGNGSERVQRLKQAGYNPTTVQQAVNSSVGKRPAASSKKSARAVALEIYNGKGNWGTGSTRVNRLRNAGYNPTEVQNILNTFSY